MIGAVGEFFELMKKATDMSDISYMVSARRRKLAALGSHESFFMALPYAQFCCTMKCIFNNGDGFN